MQHADARKTYYAFARGDAGWIDQHLEERQIKDDNGVPREASTVLHCVGACGDSEERSSLVVATPSTGRCAPPFTLDPAPALVSDLALALVLTLSLAFALAFARWHQIRKHLNGLSHPVIGDSRHGDTKINRYWRERGLERLGLHCASMELPMPDGTVLRVECPPPRELTDVWRELPWWEDACAALPLLSQPPPEAPPEDVARFEAAVAAAAAAAAAALASGEPPPPPPVRPRPPATPGPSTAGKELEANVRFTRETVSLLEAAFGELGGATPTGEALAEVRRTLPPLCTDLHRSVRRMLASVHRLHRPVTKDSTRMAPHA